MQRIVLHTPAGESEILTGPGLATGLTGLKPEPVLLVDENVLCQHEDIFGSYRTVTIPAGEAYKTLQTVEAVYRELVELEVDRSSLLVGTGGGLATDVAGFAASTYMRQIRFGFISTTLLGQVDAAIGGKNGVNLDGYKNMVGTIRQPGFIWNDLSLLKTLSRRQYVSGIAEVIKYGAIRDRNFLEDLEKEMAALLHQDMAILEKVVTTSASIKVRIVQEDVYEKGLRRLLNFGHTFGHAIERETKLLHGEAISIGMVLAARLSHTLGMLPSSEVDRLTSLLESGGLPVETNLDAEAIFQNLRKDKKRAVETIHFVLLESAGQACIRQIPLQELKSMLHDLC